MQHNETDDPGASNGSDAEARLVAAAMTLAAEKGWPDVTISAAAKAAGIDTVDAFAIAPTKRALLTMLGRHLDRAVAMDGPGDPDDSIRDRLFDLLMRRFDALMPLRDGLMSVIRSLPGDPVGALSQILSIEGSMRQTLDLAGVPSDGVLGELRVRALTVVYLVCLRAWTRDDSDDMAVTMATLDRRLNQTEQVANLFRNRGPFARKSGGSEEAEAEAESWEPGDAEHAPDSAAG